jgi:hypothetical protein
MTNSQPSLTQIQRRYIDAVNAAQPRYRALARSAAAQRMRRDLGRWGFTREQIDQAIDDARAIEVLERAAQGAC